MEAFGIELEVMDQRFHRLFHLGAFGRGDLAIVAADRTFGHVLQALFHDARGLADFFDADHEPVIAIAPGADGNVEFHPVIDIIGLRAADIPGNARAPDHRAGKAPFERIFLGNDRDIDIALLEDAIVRDKADRILEQLGQARVEPVGNVGQQLQRHILMYPAGAEPCGVHPRARRALEEVHAILADLEQPEIGRHRAHVHDVRTEIEHVIADARQFREQDAQILSAERHLHVEQLFDRKHIAMLHAERRAIIEPVEIGQRLQIGLVFDQLFGAAVEQADMRIEPLDDFAVQLHDKAEHAVRRRVLRAEIDRVIVDLLIACGRRDILHEAHNTPSPSC